MANYALGLDYGTNSVRAVIVRIQDGEQVAQAVWNYRHGEQGILLSGDPNCARQHPLDYVEGAETTIRRALASAKRAVKGLRADQVVGIGVDTTGSTPLPVDRHGVPLAMSDEFADNLDAMAWLWKDHTSVGEAEEITARARQTRPQYLAKCGGKYSSEWFFSKVLHCRRANPRVFRAADSWVEIADWIPAMLTGTQAPGQLTAGICAAGHKAMYHESWGGYPDEEFLGGLDASLGRLRGRLPVRVADISSSVGGLSGQWARRTGLAAGTPVAVGAFDAHLGAVGAGIAPGVLVKIIGTSTCDMMIHPAGSDIPDIPGLCGIVPGSILPGYLGLEAGQSAVGDIFNWFVGCIRPLGGAVGHKELSEQAARLAPGQSGLLALDWNNGNRTILVDQRLTGLLMGQTLHTTPGEIYRALIEATAFGARTIMERFEEYGVPVRSVINCGGIAEKNPLVMQIYADVTGRPMKISGSPQTCALGAAMAGAVAAGKARGGCGSFRAAQKAMSSLKDTAYRPSPKARRVYDRLYQLYRRMHDAMGTASGEGDLAGVMKTLLDIRESARS